jgi:hypothetical protein
VVDKEASGPTRRAALAAAGAGAAGAAAGWFVKTATVALAAARPLPELSVSPAGLHADEHLKLPAVRPVEQAGGETR